MSQQEFEEEPDRWAEYRDVLARCTFVQKTFSRSPMLVALEPTESGFQAWFPYTGQDYDPARWRLVPGGWDHEHCFMCMRHIVEGDAYWTNSGRDELDLCEACYSRYLRERPA